MKTTYSQDSITPFGGIHFIYELLSSHGIDRLINQHLGARAGNCRYQFSDLIYGLLSVFFCGGACAEDIQDHIGPSLNTHHFEVASPDTLLRLQQELPSKLTCYRSRQGIQHQFNWNGPLARLNLKVLKKLGRLAPREGYTLDYDNVILATEKADAARTYLHHYGYQPGVAMIGGNIVYVENRNGNSEPMFRQYRTIRRLFWLLGQQGITVKRFRADSGSYLGAVVEWVADHSCLFYIKARLTQAVTAAIQQITDWQEGSGGSQWGAIAFTPFKRSRHRRSNRSPQRFRLVVERVPREGGQGNLFADGAYDYQAILTSDSEQSAEDIFGFYRQRGAREREFDVLKNDFGWNHMPFSKLNQNTVYLMITALIRNLYGFVIARLAGGLDYLQPNYRLKKFIFRFITVPAKWIHKARQRWLKLYTRKMYPD